MIRTCQVQVVAFENERRDLERALASIGAAIAHSVRAGELDTAAVAVGDCSPSPIEASGRGLEPLVAPASLSWTSFGENLGSSGGNNRLAAGATSDVLMLVNPDTYVAPSAFTILLARLDREPEVAIVEARQIPFEHPKEFDARTGDTGWACACLAAVRRDVYEALSGFDESLPLHGNDVDLSWRARLAGWRVVHEPLAVVFHDRRFGDGPSLQRSDVEVQHIAFSSLVLAHKYGRPDALEEAIDRIERGSDVDELRGLAAFRTQQRAGSLPDPVDDPSGVATFDGRHFARHLY